MMMLNVVVMPEYLKTGGPCEPRGNEPEYSGKVDGYEQDSVQQR